MLTHVNPNESPPAKKVQETRVNPPVSLRKESANPGTIQGLKAERFQPRVNPVQLREPFAALLCPERRVQAEQKARSTRPVGPPLQPPWPLGDRRQRCALTAGIQVNRVRARHVHIAEGVDTPTL